MADKPSDSATTDSPKSLEIVSPSSQPCTNDISAARSISPSTRNPQRSLVRLFENPDPEVTTSGGRVLTAQLDSSISTDRASTACSKSSPVPQPGDTNYQCSSSSVCPPDTSNNMYRSLPGAPSTTDSLRSLLRGVLGLSDSTMVTPDGIASTATADKSIINNTGSGPSTTEPQPGDKNFQSSSSYAPHSILTGQHEDSTKSALSLVPSTSDNINPYCVYPPERELNQEEVSKFIYKTIARAWSGDHVGARCSDDCFLFGWPDQKRKTEAEVDDLINGWVEEAERFSSKKTSSDEQKLRGESHDENGSSCSKAAPPNKKLRLDIRTSDSGQTLDVSSEDDPTDVNDNAIFQSSPNRSSDSVIFEREVRASDLSPEPSRVTPTANHSPNSVILDVVNAADSNNSEDDIIVLDDSLGETDNLREPNVYPDQVVPTHQNMHDTDHNDSLVASNGEKEEPVPDNDLVDVILLSDDDDEDTSNGIHESEGKSLDPNGPSTSN